MFCIEDTKTRCTKMESRMNNDITSDYKYVSAKKQPVQAVHSHALKDETSPAEIKTGDFNNSMTYLGNMGYAKVKMDKIHLSDNTAKAIDEFLKNPDMAEMHTEFCDSLVENGDNLMDAIIKTDKVFDTLSQDIYDA